MSRITSSKSAGFIRKCWAGFLRFCTNKNERLKRFRSFRNSFLSKLLFKDPTKETSLESFLQLATALIVVVGIWLYVGGRSWISHMSEIMGIPEHYFHGVGINEAIAVSLELLISGFNYWKGTPISLVNAFGSGVNEASSSLSMIGLDVTSVSNEIIHSPMWLVAYFLFSIGFVIFSISNLKPFWTVIVVPTVVAMFSYYILTFTHFLASFSTGMWVYQNTSATSWSDNDVVEIKDRAPNLIEIESVNPDGTKDVEEGLIFLCYANKCAYYQVGYKDEFFELPDEDKAALKSMYKKYLITSSRVTIFDINNQNLKVSFMNPNSNTFAAIFAAQRSLNNNLKTP